MVQKYIFHYKKEGCSRDTIKLAVNLDYKGPKLCIFSLQNTKFSSERDATLATGGGEWWGGGGGRTLLPKFKFSAKSHRFTRDFRTADKNIQNLLESDEQIILIKNPSGCSLAPLFKQF